IIIDELFEGEYALFMIGMLLSLILLFCLFLPFMIGFTLRRHIRLSPEGLRALGFEAEATEMPSEAQLVLELKSLGQALARRGLSIAWAAGESGEMSDGGPHVTYEPDQGAVLLIQPSAECFSLSLSPLQGAPNHRRLILNSEQLERERVDTRRISVLEAAGAGWILLTIDAVGMYLSPGAFTWGRGPEGPWLSSPVSPLQRRLLRLSPWR
ncbi:MAG: hypothetical protein VYD19_03485, partial [Myxococcota bacterium]|nr:hypothetical protein [Myxococcota bacterium]